MQVILNKKLYLCTSYIFNIIIIGNVLWVYLLAGKLEFDRGAVVATTSFKRTNFAILDLKYILTNPPISWSALMVKNFTNGIDSFLKFLSYMQVCCNLIS